MGRLFIALFALGIIGCVCIVSAGNRFASLSETDETVLADDSIPGEPLSRTPLSNLAGRAAPTGIIRNVAAASAYMQTFGPEFSSEAFFFNALDAPMDLMASQVWQQAYTPGSRGGIFSQISDSLGTSSHSQQWHGGRPFQGSDPGTGGYLPVSGNFSGSSDSGSSSGGSGGSGSDNGNSTSYASQLERYLRSAALTTPTTDTTPPLTDTPARSGGASSDVPQTYASSPSSNAKAPLAFLTEADPPNNPDHPVTDIPVATPEPGTMILAGLGLFGLGAARRRKGARS
ncbi:PEP-CTERM sorting domain-containing protein [Fundidesulfovibrio terrae]|uniref:PEP-CTERM sorting domain-containing protein n=1 Tax=Fundidesulfovibrio terrae TaxID=2922866 RepID=UPI001FAFB958|nr:PEP-CTERM sorting domain-containing protein [Fundidesulfovibrio terrae]